MSAPQTGENTAGPGPLHGLRVLELADEKGQFCGKLMADLGADVIKIEPPGGQHTRLVGPFLDDVPHRERSLSFWHYNTSKRGMTLNLEHPLLGQYKIQGIPFTLSKSPAEIYRPAPLIGQHTREVLTELLGLSLQDIRDGYADGTFWPAGMPMYPYIEEALA